MAQLIVRKLDESLVGKLKVRASLNGHSTEEEHRIILSEVLNEPSQRSKEKPLKDYLMAIPIDDVELDLPERNLPNERKVTI